MKIIKLSGGLGNQMFQYAFGVALKHAGEKVLYDNGWYEEINNSRKKRATKRNYELKFFNADIPLATSQQVRICRHDRFCGIKMPWQSHVIKEKCAYSYYAEFLSLKKDAYFAGVFCNQCYFDDYRQELLEAFSLKEKMSEANCEMLEKIVSSESVSMHIRRGDYVKLGLTCNLDYYYQAVKYIASNVEQPHFYIFSDDVSWVKDNLKIDAPHTFVEINDGSTGYCDLELMKNCRHNITANSTFSWWAAYLNQNPHKIVLSPQNQTGSQFRFLFKGGYK